ncbi:MAG: ATP-binding cassette domain-containing protein [Bacteriovoracaceae bacterium]|nr:ATP-binding cassette domain-containing protein [Bacteriovoracaceae bacterium]
MNTIIKKEYIEKFLQQDSSLPKEVRSLIEHTEEIILYGLCDLSHDYKLEHSWIILTHKSIFVASIDHNDNYKIDLQVAINRIQKVKEVTSLSATTYLFLTSDDMSPLMSVRFTNRQKIIMGHIKYLVEQMIGEGDVDPTFDADVEYGNAILRPLLEARNNTSDKKNVVLLRLLAYLLPYKKQVIIGTAGAVMTTIISLVPAYLSGYLIDSVIRPFQDGKLTVDAASHIAWIIVASIGAILILRELFSWLRLNKMSIMGELVARDIREELYSHLQTLSLDFFSNKQTGSIISRVSSDTDRIWDFIAFGVVEVGIALITLAGLGSVLIYLDPLLGLLMVLPVPILLISIFIHGEKMKKMFLKAWRKWSDLTNVLSDTIPGISVVKAFNQEDREIGKFNNRNKLVTSEFNDIHRSWTSFWPLLMLGVHAVTLAVWSFATPRLVSSTSEEAYLSAGTFVSFLLYMTMFSTPIEIIGQMARMLNRALSSAYRIFEILDTKPTISVINNPVKLNALSGEVEFSNVSFSYDGVRKVIHNMNFVVGPGEMIGLVGTSGGGKSTLTKLIARFYDVNEGSIFIDGVNIKDLELGMYRRQVGMVLQEPYLFHGNIKDNIGYGLDNVSLDQIIEAAKIANAHDFILKLAHGYDTIVGERGHTLSGGERQRVSIARAILHGPKILILDEATSAVDTETEHKIQEALDKLIKGRTVFAVAHRLSTLRKANRIFVIDNGKICEQGTHSELLAKVDGQYSKLYTMQQQMSGNFAV